LIGAEDLRFIALSRISRRAVRAGRRHDRSQDRHGHAHQDAGYGHNRSAAAREDEKTARIST
jgi:hypothetical protein